jgi:von Willebrand factor type A domain-containing protein
MTQLLLKLLGARVDDAVNIARASLAFRGGIGMGWLVLLLLGLGGAMYWMYRQTPVPMSPRRKYTLAALRILFVALILGLLLRPVLALTVEGSIRRLLVVLVDTSASMQIRDPRVDATEQKRAAIARGSLDPQKGLGQQLDRNAARDFEQLPRVDVVKSALKNERLNLLPRLDRDFDLAAFTFGQNLLEISARRQQASTNASESEKKVSVHDFTWVNQLQAESPATAVGDALREVVNRKRGQPLAGVLVITDGANNSGAQPLESAAALRQEGVPVYVYGVGITSPRDIILANVFAPDVTFVKDEVALTVRVRSQGLKNETADVLLKLGSETVATKTITFAGDGEQVVPLRFTPQTQGDYDLEASIQPRNDEAVKDNNARSQRLRVIDAKIKVLMVEQSPRWEFRYLQAMLLRDRRVELQCYLIEGDPGIIRGENSPYIAQFPARKEELFRYDLVIFGDVDPRHMSSVNLENLNELVSRFGGALVVVAGKRFTPNAYRRTVLENLLPVEFEGPSLEGSLEPPADKPVRLELTSAGRANAMLRLSDSEEENAGLWKQLPPVYWVARVSRPKPAAEVLLVDPDPARESRFGKMPVMAVQQYGLGQVMYVGTDNTWRWRKNVGDLFYTTIWGQIAQHVSLQRLLGGSKRTQLTTDRQNYMTGDRVSVYARLYSAGFEPIQEPSVKGIYGLKAGQGTRFEATLRAIPEQPGLYRGEFIAAAPGAYQFFVEQDLNAGLEFNVAEPRFEFGDTAMNESLLREMAATTGGAFFREEDLSKLPDTIRFKTERVQSPLEVELWSSPLYFLLLLGVVTVEWVLRKMSYLK